VPPLFDSPHATIEPSVLRAAKAYPVVLKHKEGSMNSITFNTNFTRILLLKIAVLAVLINTAIAGEGSIELNRFTEVDVSSANNDSGGYYNASNHPTHNAFATLQADGSITAWQRHTQLNKS
jgi:hypothetical protein